MATRRFLQLMTGEFAPRSYTLGYEVETGNLIIGLVPETAAHIREFFSREEVVSAISQNYQYTLVPSTEPCWGFDYHLLPAQVDRLKNPEQLVLPAARAANGHDLCLEWHGQEAIRVQLPQWTESEELFWYNRLYAIVANLSLLFGVLLHDQPTTHCSAPQLTAVSVMGMMDVDIASKWRPHMSCLSVIFAEQLVTWIKGQPRAYDEEVTAVMRSAANRLTPQPDPITSLDRSVYCTYWEGAFTLNVLGNCACMGPEGGRIPDASWEISTHNVDHAWQQLNMLVGIAALETRARRELGL